MQGKNFTKKIAIFVPNVNPGGTERVAQRLAIYFGSKNIEVTIFTMSEKDFPYDLGNTQLVRLGFGKSLRAYLDF